MLYSLSSPDRSTIAIYHFLTLFQILFSAYSQCKSLCGIFRLLYLLVYVIIRFNEYKEPYEQQREPNPEEIQQNRTTDSPFNAFCTPQQTERVEIFGEFQAGMASDP
jgi:Ca2+/Na+ antiporter